MIVLPPELITERLRIRPFNKSDLNSFKEFMQDRIATEYLNFSKKHKTPEGAERLFYSVLKSYDAVSPIFALVIAGRDSDIYLGSCGLAPLFENVYECYYSLLPQYWRNGYATEAMNKLFDYVFSNVNIEEIHAYTSTANFRGSRVAERLGMKFMGISKYKDTGIKGRMYVIAREDYVLRKDSYPD